jgi:PIN domain nuclease of toxin-antitoxin system
VKLLLDTFTFLWSVEGGTAVSERARAALADPANDSLASRW